MLLELVLSHLHVKAGAYPRTGQGCDFLKRGSAKSKKSQKRENQAINW